MILRYVFCVELVAGENDLRYRRTNAWNPTVVSNHFFKKCKLIFFIIIILFYFLSSVLNTCRNIYRAESFPDLRNSYIVVCERT